MRTSHCRSIFATILSAILLTAGCSPDRTNNLPSTQTVPVNTAGVSTIVPTATTAQTSTPTVPSNPVQAAEVACITPAWKNPEELAVSGKLFLSGPSNLYEGWWLDNTEALLDLDNHQLTAVTPGEIAAVEVSPDHTKYVARDEDDQRIKVYSNNGQLMYTLPEGEHPYSIDGWLDNEHIALVVQEQEMPGYMVYPREMVIFNPFTGEKMDLPHLYPDIDVVMNITWEGGGTKKYDPQRTRVVYAGIIENDYQEKKGKGYILWDMEKQEKLVEIVTGEFLATPKWSSDGTKFVINETYRSGDFYVVTRDGVISKFPIANPSRQTEHKYSSDRYSWSPDGQLLAFWRINNQDGEKANLAVLNTVTGEITDYCIDAGYLDERAGEMSHAYLPVWSPDGKSVALIANAQKDRSFETLLIQLEEGFAAKIGENMVPAGWLVRSKP